MKKLLFLLLIFPFNTMGNETMSLKEAYQRALKQSDTLAIEQSNIDIASAHYQQALGTVLPNFNGGAEQTIQDGKSGSANSFNNRYETQTALSVSQPLFQGFREFRSLRIAHTEKNMNRQRYARAKHLLFYDVTKAYYNILKLEKERSINQSLIASLRERKSEIADRIKLGKSRTSEMFLTEAELANKEADLTSLNGLISAGRDYLAYLTGGDGTEKLLDQFKVPAKQAPLSTLIDRLPSRPDLIADRANTQLTKGKLNYAKGARLPTLDANGNYYPYRNGFQESIDWDVNFTLKVPIFDGGATEGSIKEAKVQLKQAQHGEADNFKKAQMELEQTYHRLTASQKEEAALSVAARAAEASYLSLKEEYRNSLINNIEVLDSLKQWHEKRLDYNQAHFQTKLYYLDLLMASDQVPFQEEASEGNK